MFTGIIEEVGKVSGIEIRGELRHIKISCSKIQEGLIEGASVCCNGICLTIIRFDKNSVTASVMPETVTKTSISAWQTGSEINLERALTLQSRLDGHLVQGHIDTVVPVSRIESRGKSQKVFFHLPRDKAHLIAEQGSVAVNGASLTVCALTANSFAVSLVEFTLANTNLIKLKAGDKVNIEFDIIGKYVYNMLKRNDKELNEKRLYELGF